MVGPTHPFRGGIPRHTTLFVDALAASGTDVDFITYTRQYPNWLYKGESDRDPQQLRSQLLTPDRLLDGVGPHTWWRTATSIADRAPDVLLVVWWHPFFAPAVGTVLRRVRRRSPGTTLLALCHNVMPHESTVLDRRLVRHALAPVDGLVVHAATERDVAHELLRDVPVTVTPHPTYVVDVDEELPARTEADGTTTLLFFGLVRQYKGLDVLLRALPGVLAQRSVRLVVAGEFWDSVAPSRSLVAELGLGDAVDLRPGFVPEEDLARLLHTTDLAIAPYRTATQSGVVEMALGAGVPVIASRVGGLAEQVDHRSNGLLIAPDDVASLTDALLEATTPAVAKRLRAGAQARRTVRTWDDLVHDTRRFASTLHPAAPPDSTSP